MKILSTLTTICLFASSVIAAYPIGNSATLRISPNPTSPKAGLVIASLGANKNEADKVVGLIFNTQAEKSDVKITNLTASVSGTASEIVKTAYLFDGSEEIDNTSVVNGIITFSNLGLVVSKDSTKQISIRYDIRGATVIAKSFMTNLGTAAAESAQGDKVDVIYMSGQIRSETFSVQSSGPVFSLVGTPVLSKVCCGTVPLYSASFTFDVEAVGGDLNVESNDFVIGIRANELLIAKTTGLYKKPMLGINGSRAPYTICENNKARLTVTVLFNSNMVYLVPGQIFTARLESAMGQTYVAETFRATKDNAGNVVTF